MPKKIMRKSSRLRTEHARWDYYVKLKNPPSAHFSQKSLESTPFTKAIWDELRENIPVSPQCSIVFVF